MSSASVNPAVSCAIAVMAKQSIPGKAKSRLMPVLGPDGAAEVNTAFLRDIAANLAVAGEHVIIDPLMSYAPAGSEPFFRSLFPSGVGLMETVGPNFGVCLLKSISGLLERGYHSGCLLNSDSPTLPSAYLIAAAAALAADGDRMVIGPAIDGGYYLIGMKRLHARLFEDIEWSTESVFDQTMDRAREIGLPVVVLPNWYDVDDTETMQMLVGELFDDKPFRVVSPKPPECRHTRATLGRLLEVPAVARALGHPALKPDAA